ncbi:helix-turn-helix domain-containing protein [Streptomyces sp. SID5770]|uniref:helix-turn-helix domain-containing protein n=1 Tax=Streptomyces sp. SID5770 TaxID=2690308 RepID=UPI00136E85A4|nr:helix-turn-helix domain-containing protein [Streptomyces sp. SID5770]MZE52128.1 helix-turn-helix domain-containing protein [Streptomyces sp. SID5770]
MVIEVRDARLLSPAAQKVVQLRVVAALEAGRVCSYRQAAEVFGVSPRSVGTWWCAYRAGGRAVKTRTGRGKLIGAEERVGHCHVG